MVAWLDLESIYICIVMGIIAAKYNSDAADVVAYIPPSAANDFNSASLCVWIVPGTEKD